jgi:hypothetical protein
LQNSLCACVVLLVLVPVQLLADPFGPLGVVPCGHVEAGLFVMFDEMLFVVVHAPATHVVVPVVVVVVVLPSGFFTVV